MINIVLLKEEARECKSLKRGGGSEVLASRKGDSSDAISEVSGTANTYRWRSCSDTPSDFVSLSFFKNLINDSKRFFTKRCF